MLVLPEEWTEHWKGQDVFEKVFSLQGKVFRQKEGRKTLRFTLDGRYYFAKIHSGVGWMEIIKNLFQLRLPVITARNEWRAIQKLELLGIGTTPLVGYGKRGWNPAHLQSFVITEELENTVTLEDFCLKWKESPPDCKIKYALIREVAKVARTFHQNGMNHRDFYICHFLLDVSKGSMHIDPLDLKIYLTDLHRVSIRKRTPLYWRVKDIGALYFSSMDLGLTKRDLFRFMKTYRNRPLKETLEENGRFWKRVRNRSEQVYHKFHKKNPRMI